MSEISPELLSYTLNGILAVFTITLGLFYKDAKPELARITGRITQVTRDVQVASSVLNQIKSLVTTFRAAAQDQTITPQESEKIIKEIEELVNSEPVKKLLGEG